jgi:hypothetical protein
MKEKYPKMAEEYGTRTKVDFTEFNNIIDSALADDFVGGGVFFTAVNMCMLLVIIVCVWLWIKLDKAERSGGI